MNTDPASPTPANGPQPLRSQGKVFDVMRPGKAPASPTSRPVVIGHKAAAQALQVRVSGIGNAGGQALEGHKKADAAAVGPAAVAATATALVPAEGQSSTSSAIVSSPQASQAVSASETAASSEVSGASQDGTTAPDKLAEAALEPDPAAPAPAPAEPLPAPTAEPEHDPLLHEAAAPSLDGQVVVSHHTTAPRGTGKLIALVALMVFFALIVLDIVLDVGLLGSVPIPHTNFF